MKNFISTKLTICISILLFSCKGNPNDLQIANLKGRIEFISENEYSALTKFGEAVKGSFQTKGIYKYNEKGYLIEYRRYNSQNEIQYYVKHEYEDDRKLSTNVFNEKDSLISKELPTYNENNQVSESIQYNSEGKALEKYVFSYDNKGNRVEWSVYNTSDTLMSKLSSVYDERNKIIEGIHIINLPSYRQTSIFEYSYNKNNDVIEELESYSNGNSQNRTLHKYKYDKKGNWIVRQTFFQNGSAKITEREITYRN